MRVLFLGLAIACLVATTDASADAFGKLRKAYAARDAAAAAATYAHDAVVTYRYEGVPEERHAGTAAVEKSFRALFDQVDANAPLDLNFRTTRQSGDTVSGVYRLRIGRSASYGRFSVILTSEGKFASDLSTAATLTDFEEASGSVMLAADDETLERGYYSRISGRYQLSKGCELVVTRSIVRLFVRNTCTNEWRGLTRISGREWTAGDYVLSDRKLTTYRFAPFSDSGSPSIEVVNVAGKRIATRRVRYRTENMNFTSSDGTRLTGTVYIPVGFKERHAASVMIHGSGSQDRDGYASIIAVLADEMATNGRVVLAYDKRGSGGSDGDGERAGFDILAADAVAAMAALRTRPDVNPGKVGLAGSSQAGWVAARAVERGANPADVFLLGAAGAALTVAEQNLYNTDVRMRCAKIAADDIDLALAQQRAYFAFLTDPTKAAELDTLTNRGRTRLALSDWLFPDSRSTDRSASAWYVVLDPTFDPLPIWRNYRRHALFLFGEHDDATPTKQTISRLSNTTVNARILTGAQHLGLRAKTVCHADLADLSVFTPTLMPSVAIFARSTK